MGWFDLVLIIVIVLMSLYIISHFNFKIKNRKAIIIKLLFIIVMIGWSLIDLTGLGFLINGCIFIVIVDVIYLINKLVFKKKTIRNQKLVIIALAISVSISLYGLYNASNVVVTNYDIVIDKQFNDKSLLIVSDVHLGLVTKVTTFNQILKQARDNDVAAIILLGDIYDENTTKKEFLASLDILKQIVQEYPIYYIIGNHEVGFQGANPLEDFNLVNNFKQIGINVLMDQVVLLDDIYLIGRRDYYQTNRQSLQQLTSSLDLSLPMILLDHQPKDFNISKSVGIDLQLSGHSHGGQIFPFQYLFSLIKVNDLNYGYYDDDGFQAIVTSGMGTWGLKMRTAKHCEMVIVNLYSSN